MTTFADLTTLLLVFFVLLYSISSLSVENFKVALDSIHSSLGKEKNKQILLDSIEPPVFPNRKITIDELMGRITKEERIVKHFNKIITEKKMSDNIAVHNWGSKVIIQITGKILFQSGSAVLIKSAQPILDKIIEIVKEYPEYNINIKGYTDNVPISTAQFPSNWELSAIRATTVLKYFIMAKISPERLTATGYGELQPLVSNNTEENRARNRRVEFVLEKKTE